MKDYLSVGSECRLTLNFCAGSKVQKQATMKLTVGPELTLLFWQIINLYPYMELTLGWMNYLSPYEELTLLKCRPEHSAEIVSAQPKSEMITDEQTKRQSPFSSLLRCIPAFLPTNQH
jgi:hypothetical protein